MALKVWGDGSNAGVDGDWDNPANWDNDTAPVDGDDILFGANAVADLTLAPSVDFVAASFIIDAAASAGCLFSRSSPTNQSRGYVIVTGAFENNNGVVSSLGMFIFRGATSVVGQWTVDFGFDNDPTNYASQSFTTANLVFDINNYIEVSIWSAYGYENLIRRVGSTNQAFDSFTVDGIQFAWGPSQFNLHAFTINIINDAQIGTGSYDNRSNTIFYCDNFNVVAPNGTCPFGMNYFSGFPASVYQLQIIKFSGAGTADIDMGVANSGLVNFFNSDNGNGLVDIYSDFATFNFRNSAGLIGTWDNSYRGISFSGATVNFYDSSCLSGYFDGGTLLFADINNFAGSANLYNFYENSFFQGIQKNQLNGGMNFYDQANQYSNFSHFDPLSGGSHVTWGNAQPLEGYNPTNKRSRKTSF